MSIKEELKSNIVSLLEGNQKDELSRFETLIDFNNAITSSKDFTEVERAIESKIATIFKVEKVFLYKIHRNNREFIKDFFDQTLGHIEIRDHIDERTFVGTATTRKEIIVIEDLESDVRYSREKRKGNYPRAKKQMAVAPILFQNELRGAIQLMDGELEWTPERISLLKTYTDQMGLVLHNFNLIDKLSNEFFQVCEAMGDAIVKKDRYTGGHTKRVAIFSEMIGKEMNFSAKEMRELKLAALLHDVGKIGIEDKILHKASRLNAEEFAVMKEHPRLGFEILGHIDSLKGVIEGIRYHHERPDGKGYPYGLSGIEIPIFAQIISVADTFDAMISTRPYRKGLPPMEAYNEILKETGTQFLKVVVDAFKRAFEKTHMYKPNQVEIRKKAS